MRVERVVVACREDGSDWKPPSNVPGLRSGEMAFVAVTPDHIDVFSLRSHRVRVLSVPRVACREVGSASASASASASFYFYSTVVIRISSPLHSFYLFIISFYYYLF